MKAIQFVLISSVLSGASTITAPRDPARYQQAATAVQTALSEGDYSTQMREFRRLLELQPNDPAVQSGIYLAMGAAAEKAGEAKDAEQYKSIGNALDPTAATRVTQAGGNTRGDKGDKAMAIMGAAMQSFAAIQQARAEYKRQADMRRAAMPPQQQMPQPQPMFAYPQAPVGAPGYAPPPQYQAMPGYAPDPSQGGVVPMQYQNAPPPAYAPPPPPTGYQPQGPPQYQQIPIAQPQPNYPQAPQPPQYAAAPPQPAYPQAPPAPQYQQYPAAPPPDPYTMQQVQIQTRRGAMRGEAIKPLRVVHDHSQLGDSAYFETACGALLTVEAGKLIFTSSVEAPHSISASEILDLRMNLEVGRAIGAFHVSTKRGLYLNLAPEAGTREEGRASVEALRKQLGLAE